jgi:hypothetical protein
VKADHDRRASECDQWYEGTGIAAPRLPAARFVPVDALDLPFPDEVSVAASSSLATESDSWPRRGV